MEKEKINSSNCEGRDLQSLRWAEKVNGGKRIKKLVIVVTWKKKKKNWEYAQGNERKTQVPQIWKREKVNGEEKAYAWIYRKWILTVERKKERNRDIKKKKKNERKRHSYIFRSRFSDSRKRERDFSQERSRPTLENAFLGSPSLPWMAVTLLKVLATFSNESL